MAKKKKKKKRKRRRKKKYSTLAIASLICAFFVPILGLIFSIISLMRLKKEHKEGRVFALAGLIISIAGMIIQFILMLVYLAVVLSYLGGTGFAF